MKVGIIGSGTMGSGIAQVAATAGCKVNLFDANQAILEKSKESLEKILIRLIEKGRIDTSEKNRIQSNINYVNSLKELRYGQIRLCMDQDVDGSHIKGLFMNFIFDKWPSLLKFPNFIVSLIVCHITSDPPKEIQDLVEKIRIPSTE